MRFYTMQKALRIFLSISLVEPPHLTKFLPNCEPYFRCSVILVVLCEPSLVSDLYYRPLYLMLKLCKVARIQYNSSVGFFMPMKGEFIFVAHNYVDIKQRSIVFHVHFFYGKLKVYVLSICEL